MKKVILGKSGRQMPAVIVGCMRLGEKDKSSMNHFIHAAMEQGHIISTTRISMREE